MAGEAKIDEVMASQPQLMNARAIIQEIDEVALVPFDLLPNVQDEPRPRLARAVLLGARIVTAVVVGSGALLGGMDRLQSMHFIEGRSLKT
jgi:hypothetical protein